MDENKRRRVMAAIPDDLLIAEVLIHLPARSLARCRCVCRSWRAGIAAAAFVRGHLALSRARPPPSLLAVPRDDSQATTTEIAFHTFLPLLPQPPPAATEPVVFDDEAGITCAVHTTHCDGLVAVATATDRVFVCNPATREFVALPLGTHNVEVDQCGSDLAPPVALGFDRWRKSYVVARYFYRSYGDCLFDDATGKFAQDYDIGHEVFTLGGGGGSSWELTEDPPLDVGIQRPTCTRQAFYWHSWVPTPRLLRFGLRDRAFDVVPRPPTAGGWDPLDDMTDLDDGRKLCYAHAAAEAEFHVWMADDGPDLRWSLRCRVHLPDAVPDLSYNFSPVLVAGDDGDTLVTCVGNTLYRCSLRSGTMEKVVDMDRHLGYGPCSTHPAVPYFQTLLSITACNY